MSHRKTGNRLDQVPTSSNQIKQKKNKQHEPAPVVKDDDDDDDDEGGGNDGEVVEYDAKKWRRYVCVSRREEEH